MGAPNTHGNALRNAKKEAAEAASLMRWLGCENYIPEP
jgi:hypothetical protein